MRVSFILGIIGGIISFIIGYIVYLSAIATQRLNSTTTSYGFESLLIVSFIAGILGIVGGAVGKKKGGVLMIIGGILAIFGSGLYGLLALVLLIVGGVFALKEKPATTSSPPPSSPPQTSG
jgi:hypothetical protein